MLTSPFPLFLFIDASSLLFIVGRFANTIPIIIQLIPERRSSGEAERYRQSIQTESWNRKNFDSTKFTKSIIIFLI
jgi:hypothetical protein